MPRKREAYHALNERFTFGSRLTCGNMSGLNFNKCWEAIQRRDANQDGRFFVGVLSTGVYRRPSCPTRLPVRKNVRFYQSILDAERDGLRRYSHRSGSQGLPLARFIFNEASKPS